MVLQLRLTHERVQPGPGIHLAALERDAPVGMLQIDQLDVADVQAVLAQAADEEEPGIGAARRGHLLALEIGDALER